MDANGLVIFFLGPGTYAGPFPEFTLLDQTLNTLSAHKIKGQPQDQTNKENNSSGNGDGRVGWKPAMDPGQQPESQGQTHKSYHQESDTDMPKEAVHYPP